MLISCRKPLKLVNKGFSCLTNLVLPIPTSSKKYPMKWALTVENVKLVKILIKLNNRPKHNSPDFLWVFKTLLTANAVSVITYLNVSLMAKNSLPFWADIYSKLPFLQKTYIWIGAFFVYLIPQRRAYITWHILFALMLPYDVTILDSPIFSCLLIPPSLDADPCAEVGTNQR